MRVIPVKLRKEMEADPYYKKCCLTGITRWKIDWHHTIIFAGKQVNEKCFIMPVAWRKHDAKGDKDSVHNCKETRDYVEYLSLKRATKEIIKKYKLEQRYKYLTKKYGK